MRRIGSERVKKFLRKIFCRKKLEIWERLDIDHESYETIIKPGEGSEYYTILHSMDDSPEWKFYEALNELVALLPEIKLLLKQTKRDTD